MNPDSKIDYMKRKPKKQTTWTLTAGAAEFATTRETLKRNLARAGIEPKPTYSTLDIHKALAGDLRHEQARLAKAKADEQERLNRLAEQEIIEWETVLAVITEKFINPSLSALDVCQDVEWREKVFKPLLKATFKLP